MSFVTLEKVIDTLAEEKLLRDPLSIVWHAGEPLAVPIRYYEDAFELIRSRVPPSISIRHNFQSNGTLINVKWCEFFKKHDVLLGLSIDGPEDIHDSNRRTRDNRGTFESVMRAVSLLGQQNVPFHIIAVITSRSVSSARRIIEFFQSLDISNAGFNIEEIEGVHEATSLELTKLDELREFYDQLLQSYVNGAHQIAIRELENAYGAIMGGREGASNMQAHPYGIFSVSWDGYFSTFSPELLGMHHPAYGKFVLGNIAEVTPLEALDTQTFKRMYEDIKAGLNACERECPYFDVCGGGAPSNKVFEHGTFACTETFFCRAHIKLPTDAVLNCLERFDLSMLAANRSACAAAN